MALDKVTIITGGSGGIGAGCAKVFVEAGSSVIICARGKERGEALAAELNSRGPGSCHFKTCDVTQPDDLRGVIDNTVKTHGRLDCLINNAGWHPDHRPIDDFSVEEFKDLLQLNIVSYFAGCKFALPHLRRTRGSIINMGSLVAKMGQEWASTYVASKGAILSFTKALAIDEARHGVRVNVVLPGCVENSGAVSLPKELYRLVGSWSWADRWGSAEEVGHACLFLASEKAAFITGAELVISGGAELGYAVKQPLPSFPDSAGKTD